MTRVGVESDGASYDEDAGANGRGDPKQHEVEDAALPLEALADGLAVERRGADVGEEGAAASS